MTGGRSPGILDPFIWISVFDPVLITDTETGRSVLLIRVAGSVKPGEAHARSHSLTSQDALNAAARALRLDLHERAEDAIDAAVKAGFALADYPEIGFSGRLRRDRDTGLRIPEMGEAPVTLWFRPPPEVS